MKKLLTISALCALSLCSMTSAVTAESEVKVVTMQTILADQIAQSENAKAQRRQNIDVANEGKNKVWRSKEAHRPAKPEHRHGHRYNTDQPQLRACLTYDGISCATFGPTNAAPGKKPSYEAPYK